MHVRFAQDMLYHCHNSCHLLRPMVCCMQVFAWCLRQNFKRSHVCCSSCTGRLGWALNHGMHCAHPILEQRVDCLSTMAKTASVFEGPQKLSVKNEIVWVPSSRLVWLGHVAITGSTWSPCWQPSLAGGPASVMCQAWQAAIGPKSMNAMLLHVISCISCFAVVDYAVYREHHFAVLCPSV
jgi:hypothetical protein